MIDLSERRYLPRVYPVTENEEANAEIEKAEREIAEGKTARAVEAVALVDVENGWIGIEKRNPIVPSFDGIRKLTPLNGEIEKYGIPFCTALHLKAAFERACWIPSERCRSEAFLKMVQAIRSCNRYEEKWLLLGRDIAFHLVSGRDKGLALAEIGAAMAETREFTKLDSIISEIRKTGENVNENLLIIIKALYEKGETSKALELVQGLKPSVEKIEFAIDLAKKGEFESAELILNTLISEASMLPQETQSKIMEAQVFLQESKTNASGQKIECIFNALKSSLEATSADLEKSNPNLWKIKKNPCWQFILLAISVARAQRFDVVLSIGKEIQTKVPVSDLDKLDAVTFIAREVAKQHFDSLDQKVALIAELLIGDKVGMLWLPDTLRDSIVETQIILNSIVNTCDDPNKDDLLILLAEKLLTGTMLKKFLLEKISLLLRTNELSRVAWILDLLDTSHKRVRRHLSLSITSNLYRETLKNALDSLSSTSNVYRENLEKAFKFIKKICATCHIPEKYMLQAIIRFVIEIVREHAKAEAVKYSEHKEWLKLFDNIEKEIRHVPSFQMFLDSMGAIPQKVYKRIAKLLIKNEQFDLAEYIVKNKITNEDMLSSMYSLLAQRKFSRALTS